MVIIDTSAWIEYFNNGIPDIVEKVDYALDNKQVAIGDLIFCEVLQGIYSERQRRNVSELFSSLIRLEMVGFEIAMKASSNYRLLRAKGITIRKTIDIIIGTYCAEKGIELIHNDRDFLMMAQHIGLILL